MGGAADRKKYLDVAIEHCVHGARFGIVPYEIARRRAAAYYPETNVLVPIRSLAAKSNQPPAKCILITLTPSDTTDVVHFSKVALDHNLGRSVPRVP
jgi:hypothetical protein